ncbi:DUF3426 domain-containing protein [Uliginosibacterium sp. 31-16]|uniref:DUF3426 domain-containing protein n=1 Tax=Uliginosibacterium sp. 31-16 TaxID=3068315 RepID=UPI00273D5EDC|nr:DUF3426 domain-containing protein [Uliginosibacterium sp. 31-16]MDP5239144.1 DUF3426 domain-containing protein [Uliginosibacterium sp. 31-16]
MLTTRCPHCSTVFRIRPEQLSVRGGRVRCGHCQQPFSALAHLEEMEDEDIVLAPKAAVPPGPAVAPTPPARPAPVVPPAAPATPKAAPVPVPAPAPKTPPAATAFPAITPTAPAPAHPSHSPWGALDAEKDARLPPAVATPPTPVQAPLFQPEPARRVTDPALDTEAPAFISMPVETASTHVPRSFPAVEEPAVGDDFSMNIVLDGNSLPAHSPAGDMDFDFSGLEEEAAAPPPAPQQSELGKALGVPAYDPMRDQDFGQTVMLEEPIDLVGMSSIDNGPDSLFFERERQQSRVPRERVEDRRRSGKFWYWALGVSGVLLLALLQLAYIFRVELAREVPTLRPDIERACSWLGCRVPYPQDAEQISLEGHSFNPEGGADGKFRLVVTLLNKADHPQAWPHLELTVTDRFDIAVARRVLTPAEWLPAPNATDPAFAAHSEITANLPLSINDVQAAGYRLYVFYP